MNQMGHKLKTSSVTFKMSLYLSLLITFLMAVVGFANYYSTRKAVESQALDKGWSIVRSATAFSAEHLQAGNPDLLHEHLENIRANEDVSYAAIINASGKIVAHSDQNQAGKSVSSAGNLPTGNTVRKYLDSSGKPSGYDFVAPIVSKGGSILGYFQLGLSSARQEALLMENTLNMLMISFAAIIAGIMLARVMARRILKKPIEDLKAATEHIAVGDFAYRVPVRQRDELGVLASAFNTMTGHLANLFMSVRTSATELTRSSQVILNRTEEFRMAVANPAPDGEAGSPEKQEFMAQRQMEALQEISLSAKRMNRLVDRLNALSLQFKL